MTPSNVLVYLMRRDLRLADNPIFHALSTQHDHGFTHLLPVYIFQAQQIEVSGFITEHDQKNPYPEARGQIGGFWRCGPRRATFLAESVWDVKNSLETVGSGLCIRVGTFGDVLKGVLESNLKVGGVWMVGEEGVEEKRDERDVKKLCEKAEVKCKIWTDEKYFIDE